MIQESALFVPHGVLFVMDPSNNNAIVPEVSSHVSATPSCIAVPVLHEVDGQTRVILATAPIERDRLAPGHIEAFRGTVEAPGGMVAVTTSGAETLASISIDGAVGSIEVWIDERDSPHRVLVIVTNARD